MFAVLFVSLLCECLDKRSNKTEFMYFFKHDVLRCQSCSRQNNVQGEIQSTGERVRRLLYRVSSSLLLNQSNVARSSHEVILRL